MFKSKALWIQKHDRIDFVAGSGGRALVSVGILDQQC